MNRANSRVRGLLATLALVGFMGGVPVVLVAIDALPDPSAFTWSRLTSQDDGTLALQVITAVCWVAWAVFTCQLVASRHPYAASARSRSAAARRGPLGRRCGAAVHRSAGRQCCVASTPRARG